MSAHIDRAARYAAGKALRIRTPRASLAGSRPATRDPVAILRDGDARRLACLVPERYRRMAASPFAFLRGAAAVMAQDLSSAAAPGVPVQACGDAHLMNFGAFESPEGRVLFDINDFDETLPGVDFTIDLRRLVASAAVAARDAKWPDRRAKECAAGCARAYRERMLELAALSPLDVWLDSIALTGPLDGVAEPKLARELGRLVGRSRKAGGAEDDAGRVARRTPQGWRIVDREPDMFHPARDCPIPFDVEAVFAAWRGTLPPERRALVDRYHLHDWAMKVVGVGSVGTFCAIAVFASADGEPLILQMKQAMASALERVGGVAPYPGQPGERVVEGQRMMQAASDVFLGWCRDPASGDELYVRRLKNHRLGSVGELVERVDLDDYVKLCARTLARAHARSGDAATIAGYLGKSEAADDALARFAMDYADQTVADHAALVASGLGAPARPAKRSA